MGRITLAIIILHLSLIGFSWYHHHIGDVAYDPLFFGAFINVSPIMVVFTLLSMMGVDYHGHFTALVGVGLGLALLKYGTLFFAMRQDGFNAVNAIAVALEIAYVASSGWYLAQLNII